MLNNVYRLIAPRSFQPVQVQVDIENKVVVRPTHLSICNADQRYYQGTRSEEALAKKLPMALIHEGIGHVVSDGTGSFRKSELVVLLPNSPEEKDEYASENYLLTSKFCGSGFDGFMQELVALPKERIVRLPAGVDENVAVFTELVSVAMHAITRFLSFSHARRSRIGIWGDGNVGFIVALLAKTMLPETAVCVFGRNAAKLADFTFASEVHLVNDMAGVQSVDHAFECCGGEGSVSAIDQIIDMINPEGTISLLGVSENPVPIATRMVLEKGLRIFGSSRSGRRDFEHVVELYGSHPEVLDYLAGLVGSVVDVSCLADIQRAFEADIRKPMGKTIMRWNM